MISQIENRIRKIFSIDQDSLNKFTECLRTYELPAKYVLFSDDKTALTLYYIVKGGARSYYYNAGKEINHWFAFEDDIITSFYSFVSQKPGYENIELLEPGILLGINYVDLSRLCKENPSINQLYRLLLEENYLDMEKRFIETHLITAKEKYKNLIEKYPHILQRVPLGYIASFLGMTQETLSRIRSEI